ncbi:MAG: hypothetical protein R3B70_08700 [Polyangiaceae bacterium]
MQQFIQANYPGSVWQYYQLIDVMWSTNPLPDPTTPVQAPHIPRSMTSGGQLVYNTTLETYMQSLKCTDCHEYAPTVQGGWFSDMSFLVGSAGPSQ